MIRKISTLAAAVAVTLLAACSSSGGSDHGTDPASRSAATTPAPTVTVTHAVTATPTPTGTPPPSSTRASSPVTSPAGPAGPAPCTNGDLRISASRGNGASEHNRYVLRFGNVSSSTCTLHGYPGVDAVNADGALRAHAERTLSGFMGGSRHGVPTVRLTAGSTASAIVEWTFVDEKHQGGNCSTAPRIAVTAANTTRAVVIHQSVALCGFQIHPTVAGSSGGTN
jgi:hypothetical protein